MTIAIEPAHLELASVARSFLSEKSALAASRAQLDAAEEGMPPYWDEIVALGWLGLHIPDEHGGSGFGLLELAIVLEEMGRVVASGPFLPTVLASAVISAAGSPAQRDRWLPALAHGDLIGAVGLAGTAAWGEGSAVIGDCGLVLGAGLAELLVLPVGDDLVIVDRNASGVSVLPCPSVDRSRRVARLTFSAQVADDATLPGARTAALRLARAMVAAEASGGARACVDMASSYARDRVQFGRPIGTFQAIKHRCADMLAQAELATAVAWDATRTSANLASAAAVSVALPAYLACATENIQVHGGIGFTWDHDAHLISAGWRPR